MECAMWEKSAWGPTHQGGEPTPVACLAQPLRGRSRRRGLPIRGILRRSAIIHVSVGPGLIPDQSMRCARILWWSLHFKQLGTGSDPGSGVASFLTRNVHMT